MHLLGLAPLNRIKYSKINMKEDGQLKILRLLKKHFKKLKTTVQS